MNVEKDSLSPSLHDRPLLENMTSSSSINNNQDLVYRGSEIIPIIGDARPQIVIGAVPLDPSSTKRYSGQRKILPGTLALCFILALGLSGVTYFSIEEYQNTRAQQDFLSLQATNVSKILRQRTLTPTLTCAPLHFSTTKLGTLTVQSSKQDIDSSAFRVAGVNWLGMETPGGVPRGLAFGQSNVDDIASMLVLNGFNAVRLPIPAQAILGLVSLPTDTSSLYPPQNPEFLSPTGSFRVTSSLAFLQTLIQSLAKAKLGVVVEVHHDIGEEENLLLAVSTLTREMCSGAYWNIIGLDVQASTGCWSSDNSNATCGDSNWQTFTTTWTQQVADTCPNWLLFVQGVVNPEDDVDWPASVVAPGRSNPIVLTGIHPETKQSLSRQIVYAPAFYSPSVYPKSYFFTEADVTSNTFVELPLSASGNLALRTQIQSVMNTAFFGDDDNDGVKENFPVLVSAFGGVVGPIVDRSAAYTASRSLEEISGLIGENTNGGFVMSLNPDLGYRFNAIYYPEDRRTTFGLVSENYTVINTDYLAALKALDGSGPLPCVDL